jgi:hypothetical protein
MSTVPETPDAALERHVASFLRRTAPPTAPAGLLETALRRLDGSPAAAGPVRTGGLLRSPEWLGVGLVAALVVVAVGAALTLGRAPGGSGGSGIPADVPAYEDIRFRADGLAIDAAGRRFTLDPATAEVSSDPGDPTYRTLEWTWAQHGVEMRLSLYFASDGTRWWVSELRTYDGRRPAAWAGTVQRLFESPVGEAFVGPVDLALPPLDQGAAATHLRIDRLVLLPMFEALQPASTTGPVNGGVDGGPVAAIDAFAPGQLLHCIGAEAMTPQQVYAFARVRGYPAEYRYTKDGSSADVEPPAGAVLTGALWGSSGQLLVFASPPDDPLAGQLRITAERACPKDGSGK